MAKKAFFRGVYQTFREFFTGSSEQACCLPSSPFSKKTYRVAVIFSYENNWWAVGILQRLVASLRAQIGAERSVDVDFYAVQGRRDLLSQAMERIFVDRCDAVVTIGTWCTKETRDQLEKAESKMPHVFCAMIDPFELGVVDSLEKPGRNVSGVARSTIDYREIVESLRALRPDLKAIAVVYGAYSKDGEMRGVIERQIDFLQQTCDRNGVQLVHCPVEKGGDIVASLAQMKQEHDVQFLCSFSDFAVLGSMTKVTAWCDENAVPLCCAELSSVYRGASVGFGAHPEVFGRYAASLVADVLLGKTDLTRTPVLTVPQSATMRFNLQALERQGVVLDERARLLLMMSSVFIE